MIFWECGLPGLVVVEAQRFSDDRGSFFRAFDTAEWEAQGMQSRVVQVNVSRNSRRGTLRGMHYQAAPHAECKLVLCSRGAIFDVAVDLRPESETFRHWFGVDLNEDEGRMLYIPEGFAHGFVTLVDESELLYLMSERYVPGSARGVRWDDPAFDIVWPIEPVVMSERDASFPDFEW
jgi:dTDP-4-dehydrorhamnose 3,5-epimerase